MPRTIRDRDSHPPGLRAALPRARRRDLREAPRVRSGRTPVRKGPNPAAKEEGSTGRAMRLLWRAARVQGHRRPPPARLRPRTALTQWDEVLGLHRRSAQRPPRWRWPSHIAPTKGIVLSPSVALGSTTFGKKKRALPNGPHTI